VDLDDL